MSFVVMKFGGTSVANLDRIRNVARHVKREVDAGNKVAVVVSAMSGVTNQLVAWVREAAPLHDAREYDAVVATGEQVTAGLLAIVLQSLGIQARSWQGWQIPIVTDDAHGAARIRDIPGATLRERLERGEVAVVTGFQGIEPDRNRVSTLGRGGSDTSAVAIAAAVKADLCDIYTDVDGVYTADPRIVPRASRLHKVSYEEMLEMASLGSKVLQTRSVELAMVRRMPVRVLSSFAAPEALLPVNSGTWDGVGTIICDEEEIVEHRVVSGIAYAKDEAKITLLKLADKPGVAASIFGPLAEANINVDMIVQNLSADGKFTDITFTVQQAELERALEVLKAAQKQIGAFDIKSSSDVAKVSVIGIGMRSHAGVAAQMFKGLGEKGINILAISTSEIKISVLIDAAYAELAVRTLHSLYELGKD
jgi:aspartate kinase